MKPARALDAVYDPLYKVSDPRDSGGGQGNAKVVEKLPSFKNFFSELPTHPSHTVRVRESNGLPDSRSASGASSPSTSTRSRSPRSPKASARLHSSMERKASSKLDRARSGGVSRLQQDQRAASGSLSPALSAENATLQDIPREARATRTVTTGSSSRGLRRSLAQGATRMNEEALVERSRALQEFQQTLPPITDAKSIKLRKEALEAWEKDYWAAREAQIKAFQDQQLAELQQQLLRQDFEAERRLSERLLVRQSSSTPSPPARKQHSGASQSLTKAQKALRKPKATPLEDFLQSNAPLQGHGLFKTKSSSLTDDRSDESATTESSSLLDAATSRMLSQTSFGSPEIAAYRPANSATSVRKDRVYAQHLDNVHRAISGEKAGHGPGMPEVETDAAPSDVPILPSPPTSPLPAEVLIIHSRVTSPDSQDPDKDDTPLAEPAATFITMPTAAPSEPHLSTRRLSDVDAQLDLQPEVEDLTLGINLTSAHGSHDTAAALVPGAGEDMTAARAAAAPGAITGISSAVADLVREALEMAGDEELPPSAAPWQRSGSFLETAEAGPADAAASVHLSGSFMAAPETAAPTIPAAVDLASLAPENPEAAAAYSQPALESATAKLVSSAVEEPASDMAEEGKVAEEGADAAVQQDEPSSNNSDEGNQSEPADYKPLLTLDEPKHGLNELQAETRNDNASMEEVIDSQDVTAGDVEAVPGEAPAAEHKAFGSFIEAAEEDEQPFEARSDLDSALQVSPVHFYSLDRAPVQEEEAEVKMLSAEGATAELLLYPTVPALGLDAPRDRDVAEAAESQPALPSLEQEEPGQLLPAAMMADAAADPEGSDVTPGVSQGIPGPDLARSEAALVTADRPTALEGTEEQESQDTWINGSQDMLPHHDLEPTSASAEAAAAAADPEGVQAQHMPLTEEKEGVQEHSHGSAQAEHDLELTDGQLASDQDGPHGADDHEEVAGMAAAASEIDAQQKTASEQAAAATEEHEGLQKLENASIAAPGMDGAAADAMLADDSRQLPASLDATATQAEDAPLNTPEADVLMQGTLLPLGGDSEILSATDGTEAAAQTDGAADRELSEVTGAESPAEEDAAARETAEGPVAVTAGHERSGDEQEERLQEQLQTYGEDGTSLQAGTGAQMVMPEVPQATAVQGADKSLAAEEESPAIAELHQAQEGSQADLDKAESERTAMQANQDEDLAALPDLASGSSHPSSSEDTFAEQTGLAEALDRASNVSQIGSEHNDDELVSESPDLLDGHDTASQLSPDIEDMPDASSAADSNSPQPVTAISGYVSDLVTETALWAKQPASSEQQPDDSELYQTPADAFNVSDGTEEVTDAAEMVRESYASPLPIEVIVPSAQTDATLEAADISSSQLLASRQSQYHAPDADAAVHGDDSLAGGPHFDRPTTAITATVAELVTDVDAELQAAGLSVHADAAGSGHSLDLATAAAVSPDEEVSSEEAECAAAADAHAGKDLLIEDMSPGGYSDAMTPASEYVLDHGAMQTGESYSAGLPATMQEANMADESDEAASSAWAPDSPGAETDAPDDSLHKLSSGEVVESLVGEAATAIIRESSPDDMHATDAEQLQQGAAADIADELLDDLLHDADAVNAARL